MGNLVRFVGMWSRPASVLILLAAWAATASAAAPEMAFVDQYCVACHNSTTKTAGLELDAIRGSEVAQHPELWEKVVRRLRFRQMPPVGMPRPEESAYESVVASLTGTLDQAARQEPNPGRTDTFRRLTRVEYKNAVRDLLALEIDVASLLPLDESSHGFDNITVGELSPMLLERYINAAEKISRVAVGIPGKSPGGDTILTPPDLTQEQHIEGLPIGTRGGTLTPYTFPVDGEYEIQLRLTRDRDEHVEGLREAHEVELLLDRERVELFSLTAPVTEEDHAKADLHLNARLRVKAGPHELGVAFIKKPWTLIETQRQPYEAHFNRYRHPRIQPAIYSVSINGPFMVEGPGDTPSRRRIFSCRPSATAEEEACAKEILSAIIRRAYRRPITASDLERPMQFYRDGRKEGAFDAGIEFALAAVLVSPEFLFRVEQDPPNPQPGTAYPVSDLELASRLSFFLWSSIPDDELIDVAVSGKLRDPAVLEKQVRRMLADERSRTLITNFAAQWLFLRNLDSITPDMRLFPDFDDNLRQAFRTETGMLFETIQRDDLSLLDLIRADYTFLNERLAKHYGIPNIYGSRFRKVALGDGSQRGGLLRHGSILTVTSYATRTSPVIRGKWILENLLGVPPPPPPATVPPLKENTGLGKGTTVRERLADHRDSPACSGCHQLMDPVGFSLENFDAVGRWRTVADGHPVDTAGGLPDGSEFDGVNGLERAIMKRPEIFVGTVTEKLLTYALGRGVEYYDAPAVREILRDARENGYRFSSIILGITASTPFQMRRSR